MMTRFPPFDMNSPPLGIDKSPDVEATIVYTLTEDSAETVSWTLMELAVFCASVDDPDQLTCSMVVAAATVLADDRLRPYFEARYLATRRVIAQENDDGLILDNVSLEDETLTLEWMKERGGFPVPTMGASRLSVAGVEVRSSVAR